MVAKRIVVTIPVNLFMSHTSFRSTDWITCPISDFIIFDNHCARLPKVEAIFALFFVQSDENYEHTPKGIDMRLFRWYAPVTSPVGLTGTTIISGKEHYG